MKFCKDCKFYRGSSYIFPAACAKDTRVDPVEEYAIYIYSCSEARANDGICGPNAALFEPSPATSTKPWYRL